MPYIPCYVKLSLCSPRAARETMVRQCVSYSDDICRHLQSGESSQNKPLDISFYGVFLVYKMFGFFFIFNIEKTINDNKNAM